MDHMSNETSQSLREAQAMLAQAQKDADAAEQECLDAVAFDLPERIQSLAHAVALAEPDVTRGLGKEGVLRFRADLDQASKAVVADLQSATKTVKWPDAADYHDTSHDVHSALCSYLGGRLVDSIAAVFKNHGFDVGDRSSRGQSLVYPALLLGQPQTSTVAAALKSLAAAKSAVVKAKKADDDADVNDLWGDGPEPSGLPGSSSREW